MTRYTRELAEDLTRFYSIDCRDAWRPGGGASRLTARRLRVLADALPPEAASNTRNA